MSMRPRIVAVLVAGASLPASVAGAQEWAALYAPAADCRVTVALSPQLGPLGVEGGYGRLTVRVRRFGTTVPVADAGVHLARAASAPIPLAGGGSDTTGYFVADRVPAGRYALVVRRIGFVPRTDSVDVRAGGVDTVSVGLDDSFSEYRNSHNCRPRGFRRPGERACVTDTTIARDLLRQARRLARPEERKHFRELPIYDSASVELVRDEATCARAARLYGVPDDPPRRVIVVRAGHAFFVFDPFEPRAAGEWVVTEIFDDRWNRLTGLAG